MEETKRWEFRELKSTDIFPMFKIINKIGFKEFKSCFQSDEVKAAAKSIKNKDDSALSAVGLGIMFDVGGVIIGNLPTCETDIYKMLDNVSNLSEEEIKELSLVEFAEMILDFVKRPDFTDFFKVVSRLFK